MNRIRLRGLLPTILTLALFLGWLGVGVVHHHADQPGCEICKLLHGDVAQLSIPTGNPEPGTAFERFSQDAIRKPASTDVHQYPVRGPPLS